MWICLCRHITHTEVEEAIRKGAKTPDAIFAHHNKFPRCETCFSKMEEMVKENTEEMVDVLALWHVPAGGPCVFVLDEKDDYGSYKCPKSLFEEIGLFVSEDDSDWEITIKRYKMKKSEADNLPEFPGW